MKKFFLYIRKSTDEDDRQVLSLESQEFELNELARREHLIVVETFRESQTAKCPGRPIFNQMLDRMERGEAEGIFAWDPLFMLSVAFGQAKYYTDNLRENILRGIRQKIRRGELSAKAPLGYFNEPRLRT